MRRSPTIRSPTWTSARSSASAPAPSPPDGGDERPSRPRSSLLVVDDEPEVLHSVYDLLRIDYRVITCGDGARALDVLRSTEDVHVIMSDQRMPEMTGVELLR